MKSNNDYLDNILKSFDNLISSVSFELSKNQLNNFISINNI